MIKNIRMEQINEMEKQANGVIFIDSFFPCASILTIKFIKNKQLVSASLPASTETIEKIKTIDESDLFVYSNKFNGKRIKINLSHLDKWNDFLKTYAAFNMMGHIKIKKLINSDSISLKKLREATMQILEQGNDRLFLQKKPDFRESPFKETYQKDILEIFGK